MIGMMPPITSTTSAYRTPARERQPGPIASSPESGQEDAGGGAPPPRQLAVDRSPRNVIASSTGATPPPALRIGATIEIGPARNAA